MFLYVSNIFGIHCRDLSLRENEIQIDNCWFLCRMNGTGNRSITNIQILARCAGWLSSIARCAASWLFSALRCMRSLQRKALKKNDKHRVFLRQAPKPPKQNSSQQLDAKMPQHKRVSTTTWAASERNKFSIGLVFMKRCAAWTGFCWTINCSRVLDCVQMANVW